jgi:hypothetical protein
MSKSSVSFHIGTRNTVWRPWPKYSWVICSSIASLVFLSAPNSGEAGSRTWKSIGAGAVVLQVAPVHLVVVDEAAIEEDAAVRLERPRDDVGGIGVRPFVGRRADAPFRVRLEDDAGEVRDCGVEFVDLRRPPLDHRRIERIVARQLAHLLRAGEIHGERDLHPPWPQRLGDAGDLRQEFRRQEDGIGVDVVDRHGVDPERRQQPAVVVDRAEIVADLAPFPED